MVMSNRIALHVKPAAERALRDGHPWLFDQAIRKQNREGQAGDLAVIFDSKNRFLAIGLYDPLSPIRVKVLQHQTSTQINAEFFHDRLLKAAQLRESLSATQTNGYRLIHGENDGFPGLVIDRYADTLVIKLYSVAWFPHLRDILSGLDSIQPAQRWVLRLSRNIDPTSEFFDGAILRGTKPESPLIFEENGLKFYADVLHGHKTGFFFDQRDNRALVGKYASEIQAASVLDVFSYAGGFSLYAARGGAKHVVSLDISEPAMQTARQNFALNPQAVAHTNHETLVADAFEGMQSLIYKGRTFDMVIVDPPSFAKSAAEVDRALVAYNRLADLAVQLVRRNGLLVMASCSSRVSADVFFNAIEKGRPLDTIQQTSHAIDHPISFPEGAYLKCLFANCR